MEKDFGKIVSSSGQKETINYIMLQHQKHFDLHGEEKLPFIYVMVMKEGEKSMMY